MRHPSYYSSFSRHLLASSFQCLKIKCILLRNLSINAIKSEAKNAQLKIGLNKEERRYVKRRVIKALSSIDSDHIYKTSVKIDNKNHLANILKTSEVYNEGGIVALIKPFGVPRYKQEETVGTITQTINSGCYASEYSVEEVLPSLKSYYATDHLEVIFCVERWTSGILLLGLNEKSVISVKKCFRRSVGLQKPFLMYWAVTHGLTVPEAAGEKVATYNHYVHHVGKVPLIKKTYSKAEVMRGDVTPNIVEHTVLAHHKENDASLVEVNVLNDKNHFLRVWLCHSYSPILGDRVFGGRVKTVLGKRTIVNPNNLVGYQPPEISNRFLSKLHLRRPQAELIPVHLHLAAVTLSRFAKGGKDDVVISASPPDYFTWTCEQLSLMANDETPVSVEPIEDEEDERFT